MDPIMLWVVATNDDPNLSCLLCGRAEHIPRPLVTTYYTPQGRVLVGLHQACYDRARVPIGAGKPIEPPAIGER